MCSSDLEWIKQHGGSRYGYIRVYAPTTSTEEALAIYKADRDYLIRLETEYNRRRTTN